MSDPSDLKGRLASLSPAQRALLTKRLAAGPAAAPVRYQPMEPAIPVRTETTSSPCEHARQVADYPASLGQHRMWFLHEYAEAVPVYVIPSSFHLAGPLDPEVLAQAVADVVRCHDTLRTTFVQNGTELFQRVAAEHEFKWSVRDFEALTEAARPAAVRRFLQELTWEKFHLAAEPGFRVALARLGPQEHVLCFILHHIISDGWSRSNLWRDLATCYAARASGEPSLLAPLPVQFVDFTAWQQRQLSQGALRKQADYWTTQIAGDLVPLDLPSDRPRPALESFKGARVSVHLDPQLTAKLTVQAREQGATFFMILLAGFKTLLHRYSGCDDLLVGVPIANRQRVEVEGLIGFFANTLVMRTSLAGEPTFRELLSRVKETAVQAYAHQDMPFDQLVEMLQVRRHAGATPVFQVSFALQDFPAVSPELPRIRAEPWPVETHTAKFDLSFTVENTAAGWQVTAEYSTDLFDAERIERMLGHWFVILESIVRDPDQRLEHIPLLTEPERQQLLVEWNRTHLAYPQDKCISDLFNDQVARTPDAVAIICASQSLTYRELSDRAGQLAGHLAALGVGPDVLVGLCVERSAEMIVAMMGILMAGGAYLPLDPQYPTERLNFILKDSRAKIVIADEALIPLLGQLDSSCSVVMTGAGAPSANPFPCSPGGPASLAYVIYTSGSTGTPKGVAVEQSSVVSFLHWVRESFTDDELSGVLAVTSICFDISVFEIFGPLCWGGKLLLAADALHGVPDETWSQVRLINTVPSLIESWIGTRSCPPSLIAVNLAGEFLKPSLVDAIYRQWSVGRVNDLYGPTEATVYSTWTTRQPNMPASIGKPIANTEVYILDSNLNPVPCGLPGDLFLAGAGIARGYLHRPELTAERFIPHPFSADAQARLYRTGDLARFTSAGTLEYLGRSDHQVKLRGFRIELGEIETVLETHPDLRAAAVHVRQAAEDSSLTAYLVVREGAALESSKLRSWLQQRLPEHMVPSHFLALPALPLTANGKVDRNALEALEVDELAIDTAYAPPRNDLQAMLADAWQAALRRDRVGLDDNIFHLGGHSLLAVVVCSKVKQLLGIEIPLRWIFDYPTIESLSQQIESRCSSDVAVNKEPIPRAQRERPLPMSWAQQGMWLLQQTLPDPCAYNMSVAWTLDGPVDKVGVQRALEIIQSRHEVLRTGLVDADGQLVQRIVAADAQAIPWREVDLGGLADEARSLALEEQLGGAAREHFDLASPPLWRVLWVQLAENQQVLATTFHHSIMDEWSLGLFFHELECLYRAKGEEQQAQLAKLPVQYADFAVWQREQLAKAEETAHRDYWREQLKDLPPPLELPADLAMPSRRSGRGGQQRFQLTGEVVARLETLSRQEAATPFMTALAAFQVWLFRYCGQSDLVVATPITIRDRQEIQNLLGLFLNTLPIRSRIDGSQRFRETLRELRQTVLEAVDHSSVPFEKIVELALTGRDATSQPLHQVMFVFLEQEVPDFRMGATEGHRHPMPSRTSKCDLTFSVISSEHGWDCQLDYATDQFSDSCAKRMSGHLKEILEAIAEAPEYAVAELRLMPDSERQHLLVEWNRTPRVSPQDKCISEWFEDQVMRTPEAVAAVLHGETLSFLELNQRANRLAHHLRSLGAGPNVMVALCTGRSFEMLVALLAILKAGAAYVPLDPRLPRERLRFILSDINARLVLCQRACHERLHSLSADILILEDLAESLIGGDCSDLPCTNTAADLAYVMYTSGTTGDPKGVMVPHRAVVRLVIHPNYVNLGPDEVLLQAAPLAFDASTFELWGSLLNGAKLVIHPGELLDFADLAETITHSGVTTLWLTAALFHQMMEQQPAALAGVRQLLAGGDVLSPAIVRDYLTMPRHGRLINGYGPTENTTFTCCGVFDHPAQIGATVAIGRPIAGTCVYILDKAGAPVPVGVVGEIFCGGDGLAIGYLNAPELTAERFVPDPFGTDPHQRLYRTGDLAYWRPDGNIEFVGRADNQVKIRGYRIELQEIDHALRDCQGILDAAVIVKATDSGDKSLCAYLVTAGGLLDSEGLRAQLAEVLPAYAIPANFIALDKLPVTANGKLDRNALSGLAGTDLAPVTKGHEARNELERMLLGLWQELLGKERIGVHQNFFELGGHSLQAARLGAEIGRLLGRKLPVAALFESPTIASLARRIAANHWVPAWKSLVPMQPSGSKPPIFLVHGLCGEVFSFLELAQRLEPDQPVYGVQAIGFDGSAPKHLNIEQMATHYAAEMRSLQPDGPYHLCGYSMGGLIAYATAQELRRQGQQVALLALFDTMPTARLHPITYSIYLLLRLPERFLIHSRRFWRIPAGRRLAYFRGRTKALRNLVVKNCAEDYFHEVSKAYRPSAYPAPLDLFLGEESGVSTRFFWQWMTRGRVRVHRVPGTHTSLLEPENLPGLVKALTHAITLAGRNQP